MKYFNTDLYQNKRSVINYCNSLTVNSGRVEQKFVAQMTYGMLASGDTKLSAISMHLNEGAQRINTVDRLSKNLQKPLSPDLNDRYQEQVLPLLGDRPISIRNMAKNLSIWTGFLMAQTKQKRSWLMVIFAQNVSG